MARNGEFFSNRAQFVALDSIKNYELLTARSAVRALLGEILNEAIDDAEAEINRFLKGSERAREGMSILPTTTHDLVLQDLTWFLHVAKPRRLRTMRQFAEEGDRFCRLALSMGSRFRCYRQPFTAL